MRWMLFLVILMLALPATAGDGDDDCDDNDRGQITCGVSGCKVTGSVVSSSAQAVTCPGGGS